MIGPCLPEKHFLQHILPYNLSLSFLFFRCTVEHSPLISHTESEIFFLMALQMKSDSLLHNDNDSLPNDNDSLPNDNDSLPNDSSFVVWLWWHFITDNARPLVLFSFFQYSWQKTSVQYKYLPMTGFELRTSGVGSDRSTNWATTTANCHLGVILLTILYIESKF